LAGIFAFAFSITTKIIASKYSSTVLYQQNPLFPVEGDQETKVGKKKKFHHKELGQEVTMKNTCFHRTLSKSFSDASLRK
jgi:hypothetical protein